MKDVSLMFPDLFLLTSVGLDPLIAARDAIASYSATKQATGASAAHNTNEAGEGLHNHLVSLCPRFINEIGGEWFNEENGVGIVRRSLPKHMRYKVTPPALAHQLCGAVGLI